MKAKILIDFQICISVHLTNGGKGMKSRILLQMLLGKLFRIMFNENYKICKCDKIYFSF